MEEKIKDDDILELNSMSSSNLIPNNSSKNQTIYKNDYDQIMQTSKNHANCFQYKSIYLILFIFSLLLNIIFIICIIYQSKKIKEKNKFLDENSLYSKITELTNENDKFKNENNKLINENNKLVNENDGFKIENNKYKNENEKLKNDLLTLSNKKFNIDYKKSNYNVSLSKEIDYTNPEYSLVVNDLYEIMANDYASDVKETKIYKDKYNHVPILFNIDSKYIYYALINVISALKTKYDDTFYDYHIFVPNTENKNNIEIFEKYTKKISKEVSFTYHYINPEPVKVTTIKNYNWPASANLRLLAPEILNDLNKIIYMDADTMVFRDLRSVFNLKMDGLYYRGVLDNDCGLSPSLYSKYLNSGITLMNLKKLREDKITEIYKKKIKTEVHWCMDQDLANIISKNGKNDGLPNNFFTKDLFKYNLIDEYYRTIIRRYTNKIDRERLIRGYKNTHIIHMTSEKYWKNMNNLPYRQKELWVKYAKEVGVYEKIIEIQKK